MNWLIFALASAVFIALATVIEKKTLVKQHATKFSTTLALFNILISLIYVPFVDFSIGWEIIFYLLIVAILGSTAFLFLAKGVRHTEISVSSPLLNFGPAVTTILAFLFLGEILSIWQVLGILIIIVGTYVLEIEHKSKNVLEPFKKMLKSKYILFIFFAVLLYGFSGIADRHILSNYNLNVYTYLFFVQLFIGFIYVVVISVYYGGIKEVVDGVKSLWKYVGLVAILITLTRLAYLQAVSMAFVSLVLPIKRLSTLFVTIFGGSFFHEKALKLKIIGCIIMLLGVFFVVYPI